MNQQIRDAFKTCRVRANQFSKEAQETLEGLFINSEASRTDAVEAERDAMIAMNKATIKRAEAITSELQLLKSASVFSNQIASEKAWVAYKDTEGILTFEGFTERLVRNNIRAQQDMIGRQLASENDSEGVDRNDLYEPSEDSIDDDDLDVGF